MFTVDAPSDSASEGSLGDQPPTREPDGGAERERPGAGVPGVLVAAGVASLAAGAIHAAAAGAHGEARQAGIAFTVLAVAQIGWGVLAMSRSHRLTTFAGVVLNAGALGGWAVAKASGIGFVDGLEESEGLQFADTTAAGLAAVAVVAGLLALASGLAWASRPRPAMAGIAAIAAVSLAGPAVVLTGSHSHGAAGHGHGAAAHDHGGMQAAAVAPEPYDATLPVNLGGVEGVSAEQQARAEDLVTVNLERLPQFAADGPNQADEARLNALGYHSIGDGGTGFEHWVNWTSFDDEYILDPDHPESLVFQVEGRDEKTLVAAMYMLRRGDQLSDAPDVGGALTQFHTHPDLCYSGEENQWVVADVAMPPEECRPGTSRLGDPIPMMHVWISPHQCGPFAALDGVGAGQVAEGETQTCNHAHGGTDPAAISSEAEATIDADGTGTDG